MILKKAIDEIAKLKYSWNGNNAEPFKENIIDHCYSIIKLLPEENKLECFPTATGGVQFEYTKSNGDYFEFIVYHDIIVLFTIINKEEKEEYVDNDEKIIQFVKDFIKED